MTKGRAGFIIRERIPTTITPSLARVRPSMTKLDDVSIVDLEQANMKIGSLAAVVMYKCAAFS